MGWESAALSEVLLDASSGTWGKEAVAGEPSYPVLRSTNMQGGGLVLDDIALRKVSEKTAQKYALAEGDILVTTSSGSVKHIGKNALFAVDDGQTYLYSNFTLRMRPDISVVLPSFLYHYLNSDEARATLARITSTTSGLRNLNVPLYLAQRVPLPPLDEQRRIAHLLDEADRLQRLRKEANEKAQRILPALFVEMFGDPETNPMGWEATTLGDKTAVRMMGGGTPSKSRADYWDGDIPWLSSKDIKSLFLDDAADHITEAGVAGSAANLVPEKSTVMVMRSGILAHTAPVAMLTRSMTVNQDQKVLVANPTRVLPEFLFGTLLWMRPMILASVRSGATVHNIELSAIRRLPLLVPPLEEQKRFADAVDAVKTLYALQERVTKNTDASYEVLRSRLFAEAI